MHITLNSQLKNLPNFYIILKFKHEFKERITRIVLYDLKDIFFQNTGRNLLGYFKDTIREPAEASLEYFMF